MPRPPRKLRSLSFVLASVLLISACGTHKQTLIGDSPQPLPKPSVDMPRPSTAILDDAQRTLSDLRTRRLNARSLLTP